MAAEEDRAPGRFIWRSCGRSFWTRFGPLSVSVSARGSRAKGTLRWRVSDVFGNHHLGAGVYDDLDDAILEAETIAVRAAERLLPSMRERWRPAPRPSNAAALSSSAERAKP